MPKTFLSQEILNYIKEKGQVEAAPTVTFTDREISVEGEEMKVGLKWYEWLLSVSGFYHALPYNAYGVIGHPDGRLENLPGDLHEVPAGTYRVYYVDKQDRSDVSEPVSEMTTDGEKLTLKIIVRYRVRAPEIVLGISNPVDTLMEHIETDVAQYIRTHDHTEIADVADGRDSRLLAFFSERHKRRKPLSDAIELLGVELKEFSGNKGYVEIRRRRNTDDRQTELTRQQEGHQQEESGQEIARLKAQLAENNRLAAMLSANLDKRVAEQKTPSPKSVSDIIFISYRRTDSADIAGRIYDRLVGRFGKAAIFKDVDSIPLGLDFKEYLEKKVGECHIFLAVIGDRWLEASNSTGGNRLNDPNDFVRIEIETAIARNIPVIPLLVQGAVIPTEEKLPTSIRKLFYRSGIPIRPDPDFHRDMDRLMFYIEKYLKAIYQN